MTPEMGNSGRENGRRPSPAPGLSMLTPREIEQIDRLVQEVCAAGYGTVKIVVEKNLPRFVSLNKSVELYRR